LQASGTTVEAPEAIKLAAKSYGAHPFAIGILTASVYRRIKEPPGEVTAAFLLTTLTPTRDEALRV
jgi:hypothetical protein